MCADFWRNRLSILVIWIGLLISMGVRAQLPPGANTNGPTYTPLDSWSFGDYVGWTSDKGYAPVSFTNLALSYLGNGSSLVVDTGDTNVPAWLQYNVFETNGTTNLTVDTGTITFWFAPDWSSTNLGGTGPGEYGRLIEVGGYTQDSSLGWWSLYVDDGGNNLYFSAQTNDLSSNVTTYLSVPISWTNDYFHFVALTYSPTNTLLYLDGYLVTNGPPMTVYPGTDVLSNGFYIGSDSNGVLQAHGMFDLVYTYDQVLDPNTIAHSYNWYIWQFLMDPFNQAMNALPPSPSQPAQFLTGYDAITGPGSLQSAGSVAAITSSNIWITNFTAIVTSGGKMSMTFTIQGGSDGVAYDVFGNPVLSFGANGVPWTWLGQGYHGNTYTVANMPSTGCFLILGTPQDSDLDGLTDAYELLVSKTNPYSPDTSGDGISDSDKVLLKLNPLAINPVLPANLTVQICPQ